MGRNINDSRHMSFTTDDYTTDWKKVALSAHAISCTTLLAVERDAVRTMMLPD
jgi:hypothetical protein